MNPYLYAAAGVALLAVAGGLEWHGYSRGYSRGSDAVQARWDAAVVAERLEADRLRIESDDKLRKKSAELQEALHEIAAHKPVVRVVTRRVRDACTADGTAPVPGVRSEPDAENAGAEVPGLGEAFAHDADLYPECVARYHKFLDAVIATGGGKP